MKFRLKVNGLYGPMDPTGNNGRSYGMYMVPWIKAVKDTLGTGLKETKNLADHLRESVESGDKNFHNATVIVDIAQFPFLERFAHLPQGESDYIEVVDARDHTRTACITDGRPAQIIKDAMCKLIELSAWSEVRMLAGVLMEIENEPAGPFC